MVQYNLHLKVADALFSAIYWKINLRNKLFHTLVKQVFHIHVRTGQSLPLKLI